MQFAFLLVLSNKMGITIHFKGKIKSLSDIQPLTDFVKSIADELGWKYQILDYNYSDPEAMKGITLRPHPKSEWLDILFDKHRDLNNVVRIQWEKEHRNTEKWNSIKTQFAPIHIHISIVKILQFIQSRYIPNLKVIDEGRYWETGDLEGLDEQREKLNSAMNLLEDGLKRIRIPANIQHKDVEIADIIEKIAREEVFPKLKNRKRK